MPREPGNKSFYLGMPVYIFGRDAVIPSMCERYTTD